MDDIEGKHVRFNRREQGSAGTPVRRKPVSRLSASSGFKAIFGSKVTTDWAPQRMVDPAPSVKRERNVTDEA